MAKPISKSQSVEFLSKIVTQPSSTYKNKAINAHFAFECASNLLKIDSIQARQSPKPNQALQTHAKPGQVNPTKPS